MHILCLNSGSSSLKFAVYHLTEGGEVELVRGAVEAIAQEHGRIWIQRAGSPDRQENPRSFATHSAAVQAVFEVLSTLELPELSGVGHRVVHGGDNFVRPLRIDAQVLNDLRNFIRFAPLHLPQQIAVIDAVQQRSAALPQVACFDTPFFRTMPERAQRFPLPQFLWEAGVHRYGFHGLSYESIVHSHPMANQGRVIIAHLGNGCSMTALLDGRPIEMVD